MIIQMLIVVLTVIIAMQMAMHFRARRVCAVASHPDRPRSDEGRDRDA
jgi:hypothetical protein